MEQQRFEPRASATVALSISGMTCSGCAATVTRVLSRVPGVSSAKVDFASGRAAITGTVSAAELVAAVTAAGYGAKELPETAEAGEQDEHGRHCCC